MLESLENPRVLRYASRGRRIVVVTSDNPRGVPRASGEPDDQQERLIKVGWVTGFVDGEGCFSIGFTRLRPSVRPGTRPHRRPGYQVNHDFVVVQGARSLRALDELREFFGVGRVYRNARHDNHREHMHLYVVHRRRDLLEVIIPFFRNYPLRTSKAQDFEKFARCLELMSDERHLTPDGLVEILEIAQTMNRQKSRADEIRILRDHTPDIRKGG